MNAPTSSHATTVSRSGSWIPGLPIPGSTGTVLKGQMYVEHLRPATVTASYPVVLVHGGGGQGTDYLTTPDGRPGWAPLLAEQGFEVHVVDRPGHGRSPHHTDVLGPMGPMMGLQSLAPLFFPPPAGPASHPTAHLHTQWPGSGDLDDPATLVFLASQGPMAADSAAAHRVEQDAMVALLDRIGPAVVVAHSAGGPAAFLAADARPDLVRALVGVEVFGPPFRADGILDLAWGMANARLTYDPPAWSAAELRLVVHETDGPIPMVLQEEPARRLANLARVPIALVTGEASAFRWFEPHLVAHLEQAGCAVSSLRLWERGVHGNAHGIPLELNNAEALDVLVDWVRTTVV